MFVYADDLNYSLVDLICIRSSSDLGQWSDWENKKNDKTTTHKVAYSIVIVKSSNTYPNFTELTIFKAMQKFTSMSTN